MQISSRRDGGGQFYLPDGLKRTGKETKLVRPIASANTSLQQKTANSETQIMCKRINEEHVKINREADRKEFVPLAITIEKRRKVIPAELEATKKPIIESKSPQPISQLGVINIRDQLKQLQQQIKPIKKPEQQKKMGKTQPKGLKPTEENRANSLLSYRKSVRSPKNVSKKDTNPTTARNVPQQRDLERSKSRDSFRQDFSNQKWVNSQTLPSRSNTSHSKSKGTISTERNTLRREPERKDTRPQGKIDVDQMVKENAKKLLEEKKRKKQEEKKQREFDLKKKHRIIEEDQKIRQFNRQFFQTDRQSPGRYAWGIDQRKFHQQPHQSARDRADSSPSEGNKKYYKLDDKERREKLGLGQISNKFNRKSRPTVTEEDRQKREESSSGRGKVIKQFISAEQEQKLKAFMGIQRQKMEEHNRAVKKDKQQEKLRIKENLARLREEQKALSQRNNERGFSNDRPSTERGGQKKTKPRSNQKDLYYFGGISNEKDKDSINFSANLLDQNPGQNSLSLSEDEHNYSLLYNEYRKIINEKQTQQQEPSKMSEEVYSQGSSRQNYYPNNKSKNTTGTKGFSDRNSARSEASNQRPSTQQRDPLSTRTKEKASAQDEKAKVERRTQVKKQFIELAKRLEDALGFHENVSGGNLLSRRYGEEVSYHTQSVERESEQNTGKNVLVEENKIFNELVDSHSIEENKSLESVEYREPEEEEEDASPKSRREITSVENRLDFLPNVGEYGEENYNENDYNDDEAYQHNFGIIEAAAIFIQKNFRGYLTRKILREYIDEMNAMYQYAAEQEQANALNNENNEHLLNLQAYEEAKEQEFPIGFHQRLTRSLDERLLSGGRGFDDDDDEGNDRDDMEENDIRHLQGIVERNSDKRLAEDVFDEKYFDIYEQISKQYQMQPTQPVTIEDQAQEQDQDFYQGLNEKLQREMINRNAGHYERKNKFLEDDPKFGDNEPVDISIEEDEAVEQRKSIRVDQNKDNENEHSGHHKEKALIEGYNNYREQMMAEDRVVRPKAQTYKDRRGGEEGRPKRRFRGNKSENQSDSPLSSNSRSSSEENMIFSGANTSNQEKQVIISTINSDEDLVDEDGNSPARVEYQGSRGHDNSLDRQMVDPGSEEGREPEQPEQGPGDGSGFKLPLSTSVEIPQNKPKNHNELLIKEINDNSKSLITVGVDDEGDREFTSRQPLVDKFKSDNKISEMSVSKENFDEETKNDDQNFEKSTTKDSEKPVQLTQSNEKELLQKTIEITSIYHHELARVREEQAKKITDIINQLSFLQSSDSELSAQTKYFIENLQNQLEENKKNLQEDLDLQKIPKAQLTLSEDKSLLNDLEHLVRQGPQSNLTSMQNTMNPQRDLTNELGLSTINPRETKFLGTFKRKDLQIDTDSINRELSEEKRKTQQLSELLEGTDVLNLDLTQMRLTLGSERLIREQSAKAMTNSFVTPTGMNDRAHISDFNRSAEFSRRHGADESGTSIFERDSFKEFTNKKFRELLKQENLNEMIKMREQALEFRHNSQVEYMNKMLENKRVSPRTFQRRKLELEKWVTKEREQIKKSKRDIQKGWTSFAEAMKRTERDMDFMKKISSGEKLQMFPDDENLLSARRLPFRSDGETGESDIEYSSQKINRIRGIFQQDMFGTPGSARTAINIIPQYEFQPIEKTRLANNFVGVQAEDERSQEGTSPMPKKSQLGNQEEALAKQEDKKGFRIGEYQLDDSESLSFEGSLRDTAALKKRLRDLNIQIQDREKDSEFEEHIKELSVLQEELNQLGNSGRNVFDLITPQGNRSSIEIMEQMRSSKGFAMSKGKSSERVDEYSAELNKQIHKELQEIHESAKEVTRDLFNSPDGNNAKAFDGNTFVSPKNNYGIKDKNTEDFEVHSSVEAKFGFRKSGLETTVPTSMDSNDFGSPQNELNKFIENREHDFTQTPLQDMEGYHQQNEYICPGFVTGIDAVNEFLNLLCHIIKGEYKSEFLDNINTPLGLAPAQKISILHSDDPNRSNVVDYALKSYQKPVLTQELFVQIDERIKEEFSEKDPVLLDMESYHYRGIFNAFSEALDYYRPFGMLGVPYPWKMNKVYIPREIKDEDLGMILERTKEKVLIWCSFVCGYIPSGDFASDSDEGLNQLREERLMRFLAQEIIDTEERWVSYENEETGVQLEISDLIFDRLALEAAETLLSIKERRTTEEKI